MALKSGRLKIQVFEFVLLSNGIPKLHHSEICVVIFLKVTLTSYMAKSNYLSLLKGVHKLQDAVLLLHLRVCRFTATCCLTAGTYLN